MVKCWSKYGQNPVKLIKQMKTVINLNLGLENKCPDMFTWIGEFRPGNETIWAVVDEESNLLGPRT